MEVNDINSTAVTLILPSLNVANYIRECLDSVRHQSLAELEILCIDAGSTDGTLEILEEYARLDSRIKIVHSCRRSYGKQVNMGLEMAAGKYVAVVETDDFIDYNMYKKLYNVAEKNNLDFVKADFRGFCTLSTGQRVYDEGRVWKNDELYGKVISVEAFPDLYMRDVNIWKGLYRNDFLKKNNITLNESDGAAFQDIGFEHLFLRFAKRGMYLKDMFYFYRRDSAGSSSNMPGGLRFAYQEYSRLLALQLEDGNKQLYERYLYARMMTIFVSQYEKLLEYGETFISEFEYEVAWFKEILSKKIQMQNDFKTIIGRTWEKVCLLIKDEEEFRSRWKQKKRQWEDNKERLIRQAATENVVIFGCGYFAGSRVLFCDQHQIRIVAFCDNNPALWGSEQYGYKVCRPEELMTEYRDTKIMISTKKYEAGIKKQLLKMGVNGERILLSTGREI